MTNPTDKNSTSDAPNEPTAPNAQTPEPSSEQPQEKSPDQPPAPAQPPVNISCTRGFASWLTRNAVSLAFTSYQSGRLYLVGVDDKGRVSFHERYLARAMGMWADQQRILLSTVFQVWRFENIMTPKSSPDGQPSGECDRYYIPRVAHTTGDIDVHEIEVLEDGRVIFVNTLYSCLSFLSPTHSFAPFWKPPFISKLAAEDRCHLNGLAMRDGKPAYVSAVSQSDVVNGWRDRRGEGGCIIDINTNEIISDQLSMPHSPRWHEGELWVLNSGVGYLGVVDIKTGAFEPRVFCPGFMRGLAFHNGHAIVGLSLPRDGTFSGLKLDDELKKRDADPWCGIQIINLASGDIVEWIRLEGSVTELFAVSAIPGVRRPMAAGFLNDEIHKNISIELPQAGPS